MESKDKVQRKKDDLPKFQNLFHKNPWNTFLGDCSVIDEYLMDRPPHNLKWIPLHFINVFLRAVGQPVFMNNPITGGIIFASLFLDNYLIGLGCLLGGGIAVLAELTLKVQHWDLMRNGVAAFNGVLIGCIISGLYPVSYGIEATPAMWIFIAGGGFASILLCSGFGNFFAVVNVPYLSMPFNMICVITFLTLQPPSPLIPTEVETINDNFTATTVEPNVTDSSIVDVDWMQVGKGVLVSMSQVWAINDVTTSIVINVAVALASPLNFLMCTTGAVVGSFLGAVFVPTSAIQEVYDGVWGFNGLLTMSCLSCNLFPFNHVTFSHGLMGAVAATVAQYALRANMFVQNNIPVFSVPMVLTCFLFLLVTFQNSSALQRETEISYPEKQFYNWFTKKRKLQANVEPEEEEAAVA